MKLHCEPSAHLRRFAGAWSGAAAGRWKRWRRRRMGRAAARRDGRGGGHAGGWRRRVPLRGGCCRSPIRGGSAGLAGGRMASEKIENIGVREER